jgi:uncharacterized protein with gpF-like domain
VLKPIRPAAPIRIKYEQRLLALLDEMHTSVLHWVRAEYRRNTPQTILYGADETPVKALQSAIDKLGARWLRRFDDLAGSLADYFSKAVKDRCDRTLMSGLRDGGFSVRFKMTDAMRDAFDGTRAENVALIKSIPEQYLGQVEAAVMQSVSQGRDLASLTRSLTKIKGVSQRRAAHIALDQNNKATATMRSVRERELGITEGVWMHSGGGREPRRSHKAFSGQRFKLSEGHDFGDDFGPVLPGQAINCRCTWRAVVPGFDD